MKRTLDWNKYLDVSAKAAAEGIVMLKNDNGALPLADGAPVAVFGRMQLHYYKSGTGSGGMVNVSHVVGITEGLINAGANVDRELLSVYEEWDSRNAYDRGEGWGSEPWSQKEMPLSEDAAQSAAKRCDTAIVIIGRTAGEEMDNSLKKGAYYLTDEEEEMLRLTRACFKKLIVLLNVGGIIDMSFQDKYSPDAVLYVWQGGMVGGTGAASVLTGEVSPSGKLPDTIAYEVSDHPSDKYFGDNDRNFYREDIYVGYRYFETFAKDRVRYPFGYGLSYTTFDIGGVTLSGNAEDGFRISAEVTNTGARSGKEAVQVYCEAPQGALGKPARVLCGFAKTNELSPAGKQRVEIRVRPVDIASYDDTGASGHRFCRVLEKGEYRFYVGSDVRDKRNVCSFTLNDTVVVERLSQALAPVLPFERMRNDNGTLAFEETPLALSDENSRRLAELPKEIPYTGDKGIKLTDVLHGKNTMEEFVAQLSDDDLSCIIRGEGMGSPKVTAGTAAAFGGVSESLQGFGIPCGCCSDGPSGMRLDCGTKAFSIPGGTLLASMFNTELLTELFSYLGLEMAANRVDCLLGPGMNIHRHPLNGRNFEYFSEDPYLTGVTAAAELKGLHTAGVTGTIKHFCGNNQETRRHFLDSVISERALREIYLRGFEIAIKNGGALTVMTTYGSVNGLWTAGSYDLTTTILRGEWGFKGFAMTDWWANINRRGQAPDKTDFAAMAMAQNDVYMVCADGAHNNDNTLSCLQNGTLTRGELRRNAANILGMLLTTHAMKRIDGTADITEVINRPEEDGSDVTEDVTFYDIEDKLTIDLSGVRAYRGGSYVFALDMKRFGSFKVTVTASTELSELAQASMTMFTLGTAAATFTWNGTGGAPVAQHRICQFFSRFTAVRLYFAADGLKLHSIKFELEKPGNMGEV